MSIAWTNITSNLIELILTQGSVEEAQHELFMRDTRALSDLVDVSHIFVSYVLHCPITVNWYKPFRRQYIYSILLLASVKIVCRNSCVSGPSCFVRSWSH